MNTAPRIAMQSGPRRQTPAPLSVPPSMPVGAVPPVPRTVLKLPVTRPRAPSPDPETSLDITTEEDDLYSSRDDGSDTSESEEGLRAWAEGWWMEVRESYTRRVLHVWMQVWHLGVLHLGPTAAPADASPPVDGAALRAPLHPPQPRAPTPEVLAGAWRRRYAVARASGPMTGPVLYRHTVPRGEPGEISDPTFLEAFARERLGSGAALVAFAQAAHAARQQRRALAALRRKPLRMRRPLEQVVRGKASLDELKVVTTRPCADLAFTHVECALPNFAVAERSEGALTWAQAADAVLAELLQQQAAEHEEVAFWASGKLPPCLREARALPTFVSDTQYSGEWEWGEHVEALLHVIDEHLRTYNRKALPPSPLLDALSRAQLNALRSLAGEVRDRAQLGWNGEVAQRVAAMGAARAEGRQVATYAKRVGADGRKVPDPGTPLLGSARPPKAVLLESGEDGGAAPPARWLLEHPAVLAVEWPGGAALVDSDIAAGCEYAIDEGEGSGDAVRAAAGRRAHPRWPAVEWAIPVGPAQPRTAGDIAEALPMKDFLRRETVTETLAREVHDCAAFQRLPPEVVVLGRQAVALAQVRQTRARVASQPVKRSALGKRKRVRKPAADLVVAHLRVAAPKVFAECGQQVLTAASARAFARHITGLLSEAATYCRQRAFEVMAEEDSGEDEGDE